MNPEYSGALGRVDVFQSANGKYKGTHECEIYDEAKGAIVECTCGLRIAMLGGAAEAFANNHEENFNNPPEF